MQRRRFLGVLAAGAAAAQTRKPNFVLVLVDDLRFDALGYMGHPFVKTPNIDRLAREGAIFRNTFVTTPLCSPARASFLTGMYVRTHQVRGNGNNAELSHRLVTFHKLLHEGGYETAHIGKWHMGMDDSPRPGIDRWVSFRGQGQYEDCPLNVDGKAVEGKGYITDVLSDYAVEFVRKPRSKPFSLMLAHKAVHGPFSPAARHASLYEGMQVARSANAKDDLSGKPMLTRPLPPEAQKKAKKKGAVVSGDTLVLNQLRCLTAIDEGVGRLLQALEETRQLDNTLFIFTSDNGYFWGEHGLGDKRAAYEESIRIPMVARHPKLVKAGRKIDELVLNIDIAPTFLELAGVKVPANVQGRSLAPVLAGKAKQWRSSFLCEYFMEPQFARVATWEAVRSTRWKLVHYPELQGMDELYDLQTDPGEMKNLIGDANARGALEAMRKELERYR